VIPESLIMTWIDNAQLIKSALPGLISRSLFHSHTPIFGRPFHQNVNTDMVSDYSGSSRFENYLIGF
jgi:hypothetical protein